MKRKTVIFTVVLLLIASVAFTAYYTASRQVSNAISLKTDGISFELAEVFNIENNQVKPDIVLEGEIFIENTCNKSLYTKAVIIAEVEENGLSDIIQATVILDRRNGNTENTITIYTGTLTELINTDLGWIFSGGTHEGKYSKWHGKENGSYVDRRMYIKLEFPNEIPEQYQNKTFNADIIIYATDAEDNDEYNPVF